MFYYFSFVSAFEFDDSIVDGDWLRASDWCKRYQHDT